MKAIRKIIEIDNDKCTGCGLCVTDCAEGALKIVDGKAVVVNEVFCDGLGACIGACPEDALKIVEREAPEFDEKAVGEHLARIGAPPLTSAAPQPAPPAHAHSGCPGSAMRMFDQRPSAPVSSTDNGPTPQSELGQWPIQLKLVPFAGPLYENKDLVLIADCVAAAYPDVHRRLIKNNTIALSCPKLDDPMESIEKLAAILENPIKSLKVAIMEVPCCGGLVRMAEEAKSHAGSTVDIEVVRIGVRGEVQAC